MKKGNPTVRASHHLCEQAYDPAMRFPIGGGNVGDGGETSKQSGNDPEITWEKAGRQPGVDMRAPTSISWRSPRVASRRARRVTTSERMSQEYLVVSARPTARESRTSLDWFAR